MKAYRVYYTYCGAAGRTEVTVSYHTDKMNLISLDLRLTKIILKHRKNASKQN